MKGLAAIDKCACETPSLVQQASYFLHKYSPFRYPPQVFNVLIGDFLKNKVSNTYLQSDSHLNDAIDRIFAE